MAGNKRASMREGPLAALFRKTDELNDEIGAAAAARVAAERAAAAAPPPPHPRETGLPHPALAASRPATEAARVPTHAERVREAFADELPENILDAPFEDVYARDDRDVYARADLEARIAQSRAIGTPVLRVVGVGGAGVNAVNRMVEAEVAGVEFIAINTDLQSLQHSTADVTLHIGAQLTRGLGSGANTDLGRRSAMEEYDRIKALLKGSDMIFIAAGAGGGTGTGAAPIVARIAREIGALTVGIITKPFGFEGTRRAEAAASGIEALEAEVDTLIVVPNNRLLSVLDKKTSMVEAFRVADDVLRQGVQGVSDLVTLPGLINLDFADVRTVMSDAGNALLGIGMGQGENRSTDAAMAAVSSPLLETSMDGAHSILLSITGGEDLSLWEVNEAAKAVSEAAHPDANIIFGAMVDKNLEDQVWVTVVATGFSDRAAAPRRRLEEPAGEPRVQRRSHPPAPAPAGSSSSSSSSSGSSSGSRRRGGGSVVELEVPEFIPRR